VTAWAGLTIPKMYLHYREKLNILSEDLRDALDNMFDARVPNKWKKISWESATLGFWFTDLLERNVQFRTWLLDGSPKMVLYQ
jgi:hypothetical protein